MQAAIENVKIRWKLNPMKAFTYKNKNLSLSPTNTSEREEDSF
jgi:hypothetical protein